MACVESVFWIKCIAFDRLVSTQWIPEAMLCYVHFVHLSGTTAWSGWRETTSLRALDSLGKGGLHCLSSGPSTSSVVASLHFVSQQWNDNVMKIIKHHQMWSHDRTISSSCATWNCLTWRLHDVELVQGHFPHTFPIFSHFPGLSGAIRGWWGHGGLCRSRPRLWALPRHTVGAVSYGSEKSGLRTSARTAALPKKRCHSKSETDLWSSGTFGCIENNWKWLKHV